MNSEKSAKQKTIYDNARNHFLGNFPETLPIEQAYVHIGMYLGWIIQNELYSEYFEDESEIQIIRFNNKVISPALLSELWDGYLGFELFNKKGNMFTYYYYGGGIYKKDYQTVLAGDLPSIYHVEDSWENFDKISKKITERFNDWRKIIED
ncbi:DUF7832 domain-containing protein [Mangrovivirga cuniculi]|uniref:DUF7832 domain-containing protein n=1 Tax=Mangrovivirga cuniculi TaxID=2715131 RepID=A0A4D7JW89_9BACT|nr:hypothetical protein [Mangrovivirga cuniculi]QCK15075.1 hypothetical protein DCC35_10110 [Mangrovivirga cuniculi]